MEGEDPTLDGSGILESDALAGTVAEGFGADAEDLEADPTRIGRYPVLSKIGAGGMGVVYAAYDEDLDRKVAIKLLRSGTDPEVQMRLLAEARTMAKLAHPNVVQVFEVGTWRQRVFVAMEFVAGKTLRAWNKEAERPREASEVVPVFVQAGRGLAAAHAAGLVHRDFKPDNVLLGDDGRVRVLDFGLAVPLDAAGRAETAGPTPGDSSDTTGSLRGTPAYMSPEQLAGGAGDERSDQFAYAVALWEALHGQRPFAGTNALSLMFNVRKGKIREPPAGLRVPPYLHAVLVRGLAVEPAERFESMDALLAALEDDPAKRRRAWGPRLAWAAGLAAVAIGAWRATSTEPVQLCQGAPDKVDAAWGEARVAVVREAFASSEVPYQATSFEKVDAALRDWTTRWNAMHVEVCSATKIRGELSEAVMDRRMLCLEERLGQVEALVSVFERADATVVMRAPGAVMELGDVEACADVDGLDARVPRPSDAALAAKVDEVRQAIARARALAALGEFDEGGDTIEGALVRARELDYGPLVAEALLLRARFHATRQRRDLAGQQRAEAYFTAIASRHDTVALDAATDLMDSRRDVAYEDQTWEHHARGLLERLGRPPLGIAKVESAAARIDLNDPDRIADSVGHYEAALEALEQVPDEQRLQAKVVEDDIYIGYGLALTRNGDWDEGIRYTDLSLQYVEENLGADHPYAAASHINLGSMAATVGDWAEARRHLLLAEKIWGEAFGPDHGPIAYAHGTLAWVELATGQPEEARRRAERAAEMFAERDYVVEPWCVLGELAVERGEFEAAAKYFDDAMARISERKVEDFSVAIPMFGRAKLLAAQGANEEARALAQEALAQPDLLERSAHRTRIEAWLQEHDAG